MLNPIGWRVDFGGDCSAACGDDHLMVFFSGSIDFPSAFYNVLKRYEKTVHQFFGVLLIGIGVSLYSFLKP
jgi:hypothetical protein